VRWPQDGACYRVALGFGLGPAGGGGVRTGVKGKGSPYSITERRVPKLIPVLGSQPTDDVSHKPGGRLPLLPARPAVTRATLKRVGEQRQYQDSGGGGKCRHT